MPSNQIISLAEVQLPASVPIQPTPFEGADKLLPPGPQATALGSPPPFGAPAPKVENPKSSPDLSPAPGTIAGIDTRRAIPGTAFAPLQSTANAAASPPEQAHAQTSSKTALASFNARFPILRTAQLADGTKQRNLIDFPGAIFPNNAFVTRKISPLLAVLSAEENPVKKTRQLNFLAGVFRDSKTRDSRKLSLLGGLLSFGKASNGSTTFQLFWIPLHGDSQGK